MKAFLASIVVAVAIGVAAYYVLDGLAMDSATAYSSRDVRL